MLDGSDVFDLYCGNCFDKVGVLFNSSMFVWEFSSRINALIVSDKFSSLLVLFLAFYLFPSLLKIYFHL